MSNFHENEARYNIKPIYDENGVRRLNLPSWENVSLVGPDPEIPTDAKVTILSDGTIVAEMMVFHVAFNQTGFRLIGATGSRSIRKHQEWLCTPTSKD